MGTAIAFNWIHWFTESSSSTILVMRTLSIALLLTSKLQQRVISHCNGILSFYELLLLICRRLLISTHLLFRVMQELRDVFAARTLKFHNFDGLINESFSDVTVRVSSNLSQDPNNPSKTYKLHRNILAGECDITNCSHNTQCVDHWFRVFCVCCRTELGAVWRSHR